MDGLNLIKVKLLADEKVIRETCNRCGIANKKKRILYPSCYLYKMDGEYYIVHFKELFLLTRDNGYNNISDEDIKRRNAVIFCLKNWGLIDVEDDNIDPHNIFVFVLPHSQKKDWRISHKINLYFMNNINNEGTEND